ncbi:MAG: hypothetical protein OEZ58_20110, partial [Gammaproteobacteria bacterium]|nr:hypothetical protein [Gammaproteobacteria bacterium]
ALKGSGASGGVSFMEMLSTSGDAIRNTPGLILRNIRYKTDQLDLEVEVSSLQVLDQLKQKLMSDANMDVEIQSAASKENKVQGRLQIKAKK